MNEAAKDKRRKQQQESQARRRGKNVLTEEQNKEKRLQQHQEQNAKRRAPSVTTNVELNKEQKKEKRLQQRQEQNAKRKASVTTNVELTEEQKKEKRLQQHQEYNGKRKASVTTNVELNKKQKKEKRLQQYQEQNARRRASSTAKVSLTLEQTKKKRLQQRRDSAAKKQKQKGTSKTKRKENKVTPPARPPPHARTQPQQSLETFLQEQVLSGSRPTINLEDFPETQDYQEKFASKMNMFKMFWCKTCKERSIGKKQCKSIPGECTDCEKSRKQNGGITMLSSANDQDPYPKGIRLPPGLVMPTQIEEMLLGRIFPIMRVFRLGNGEIGYKGSVLNVEQDASPIWTRLPVRPNQYPFLFIMVFGNMVKRAPYTVPNQRNPVLVNDELVN